MRRERRGYTWSELTVGELRGVMEDMPDDARVMIYAEGGCCVASSGFRGDNDGGVALIVSDSLGGE